MTVTGSRFTENTAESFAGGAWFHEGGSLAMIGGAMVSNQSNGDGGALYVSGAVLELTGVLFSSNAAVGLSGDGGALSLLNVDAGIDGLVAHCNDARRGGVMRTEQGTLDATALLLRKNTAAGVGGALDVAATSGTIRASRLEANQTLQSGGAMELSVTDDFVVRDVAVVGNEAAVSGGGIQANGAVRLLNASITGNHAPEGAGLAFSASPAIEVVQCTVTGNAATKSAGAILATGIAQVAVIGSVLWDNTAPVALPAVSVKDSAAVTLTSTCASGWGGGGAGVVLLTESPFAPGTSREPWLLRHAGLDGAATSSPCVDAGDSAAATAAGVPWQMMTTRSDGAPDLAPIDAGRHY